ncbi:MAG: hypothetical protein GY822_15120 [Deltaproteobacteria bacterium]|nr:hypothetical protein [Deltaproteobacteria bacterium]
MHILKGNASIFGFSRFSSLIYSIESKIDLGEGFSAQDHQGLEDLWVRSTAPFSSLRDEGADEWLKVSHEELEKTLAEVTTPDHL